MRSAPPPSVVTLASPTATKREHQLKTLSDRVVSCRKCPRLISHCCKVAKVRRRAFLDFEYWGKPVPGFGDPAAELLILGLAPGAHGANRTGRMFTGDRSGEFLYQRLYEAGFANQPGSTFRDDGLQLRNAYITAAARCAPPQNKPSPTELRNCQSYLEAELEILAPRVVLTLGKIAFDAYLRILVGQRRIPWQHGFYFRHGAQYALAPSLPQLFAVYHPSQQNTQTGRLSPEMYRKVLRRIRRVLASPG